MQEIVTGVSMGFYKNVGSVSVQWDGEGWVV